MERKVLGRGLEALIPTEVQGFKERVQTLKVSQVDPSRFQPRINFSQSKLEELANSIREKGVIQPILVRAGVGADRFELIAGERRLRAVKYLGLDEIPAIVRRVADVDLLQMALIENIQREELNPIEEARAYRRLTDEFNFTQDSIAQRVGKDKTSVSNLLRILNLPNEIQEHLSNSLITFGHARALLSLGEPKRQLSFCEAIIKKGLSVRQTEFLVSPKQRASARGGSASGGKKSAEKDQDIKSLELKLEHTLGTRVRVRHGKKRGKIEIEYYSLDDLDRVLKLLGVKSD